jgi:hypothetical protein
MKMQVKKYVDATRLITLNITPMTYMDGIQAEEEKGRLISSLRGVDSSIHTQHMARDGED